jgi:hypothetical protein
MAYMKNRSCNTTKSQVTDGHTDPRYHGCAVGVISRLPPTEFCSEVITRSTLYVNEWHQAKSVS